MSSGIPSVSSLDPVAEGDDVAGYRVREHLGGGAMGDVYRVTRCGEHFAMKLLKPEFASNHELKMRFLQEGPAAARVQYPGVVPPIAFGEEAGRLYIVMRLLEGINLETFLKARLLTFDELFAIATPAARTLAAAHAEGVVHRDIKPSNIFLEYGTEGRADVKVIDFGIAKVAGVVLTQTGRLLGTPGYMAPEQAQSANRADERSDVYAFGCVLFRMACGQLPFTQNDPYAVIYAHAEQTLIDPRVLNPSVPKDLERLIVACLQKDPSARPAMSEVSEILERLAPARPVMHLFPPPRRARRRRAVAIGISALLAGAAAVIAAALLAPGNEAGGSTPHAVEIVDAAKAGGEAALSLHPPSYPKLVVWTSPRVQRVRIKCTAEAPVECPDRKESAFPEERIFDCASHAGFACCLIFTTDEDERCRIQLEETACAQKKDLCELPRR